MFKTNNNKIVKRVHSDKTDKTPRNLSKSKKSKSNKSKTLMYILNIKTTKDSNFLIFGIQKEFNHLKAYLCFLYY